MYNILVIDDEKVIGNLITQALTRLGFHVETALDGMEGIKKFDESNYDMVITDIRMPGMDGNDVIRHIRNSRKRSTPVVGISGTPWLLENEAFDAVLPKPTPLKDLIDTVTNIKQLH